MKRSFNIHYSDALEQFVFDEYVMDEEFNIITSLRVHFSYLELVMLTKMIEVAEKQRDRHLASGLRV